MKQVLGHSTRWTEERGVPPIKIGSISPGGVVRVCVPRNPDRALLDIPDRVKAVYIPLATRAPDHANITPESVLGSGGFAGSADVPPEGGDVTVKVPGVKPGEYDVQLIHEFDDKAEVLTPTQSTLRIQTPENS
jgi:hypothetical protein